MTVSVQGDQVQAVVALPAPQLLVVDMQISGNHRVGISSHRRSTCFLRWSYGSGSKRKRGRLGWIRFTMPCRSEKPAVVC